MANTETKISEWLNSGEYKTEIDNALTDIIRLSEAASSESETASIFEREIYFLIRSKTGKTLSFNKEQRLSGISHNFGNLTSRTSGVGRLDAVVNQLIIEYKHHSKLISNQQIIEASQQVEDYLSFFQNLE